MLRVLTAFSVIMLPLTLVAFGMNNQIPGEGTSEGFWIVIGAMVILLVGMLTLFRRHWL